MKHYEFNHSFGIYGKANKSHQFSTIEQHPHNPRSIYICGNCGYVEFSMNDCEEPDI